MRRLADTLTALRFLLAIIIAWIGATLQTDIGLRLVIWLTMVAWTTDWLDGPIARRAGDDPQTWLGRHDVEMDLVLCLAMAITLVNWDLELPVLLSAAILVGWLLWRMFLAKEKWSPWQNGLWPDHSDDIVDSAPIQLSMAFVEGGFVYLVWFYAPELFKIAVIWIIAATVLNPRRAWDRVRGFLEASKGFLPDDSSDERPTRE